VELYICSPPPPGVINELDKQNLVCQISATLKSNTNHRQITKTSTNVTACKSVNTDIGVIYEEFNSVKIPAGGKMFLANDIE
jgi:hypothetical protein